MQLVIDIPEDHKRVIDNLVIDGKGYLLPYEVEDTLAKAVKQSTPLPKGHGRIGDLDQVLLWMIYKKGIIDKLKCGEITPVFKDATIIEAESEETTE